MERLVYKLYVVLKRVAIFDAVEHSLVSGIVEYCFSAWKECVWGQPDRLSYSSSCPFVRVCIMPG